MKLQATKKKIDILWTKSAELVEIISGLFFFIDLCANCFSESQIFCRKIFKFFPHPVCFSQNNNISKTKYRQKYQQAILEEPSKSSSVQHNNSNIITYHPRVIRVTIPDMY